MEAPGPRSRGSGASTDRWRVFPACQARTRARRTPAWPAARRHGQPPRSLHQRCVGCENQSAAGRQSGHRETEACTGKRRRGTRRRGAATAIEWRTVRTRARTDSGGGVDTGRSGAIQERRPRRSGRGLQGHRVTWALRGRVRGGAARRLSTGHRRRALAGARLRARREVPAGMERRGRRTAGRRHVRRTADGRPARRLQSCRTRGAAGATPVAERVGGRNGGDEACGAVDGRRLGYSGAVPPRLTRGEHRTCWTSRRSTTSGYG